MHVIVGGVGLSLGAVGPRASGSLLPTEGWQPRDSTADSKLWWAFQKTLANEAAAYQAPPAREASGLVLFGDSITERLRGTSLGQPKQEALDDDAALASELADDEPSTPGGPLDALADAELDLEFERLVHSASKW